MAIPPISSNPYGAGSPMDSTQQAIEQQFQDAISRGFMGTVLVVQNGQTVFNQSTGIATGSTPNDNNTTYRWESVTKVITAVAIIKLSEMGLINLNADITDYLPEYKGSPGFSGITIKELLNYTSGIPGLPQQEPQPWITNPPTSMKEILDYLSTQPRGPSGGPPNASTNPNYQYSDTAYNLLGYLIGRVTGSYSTFVQDFIFNPAGMSTAHAPDTAAEDNPQAEGHDSSGNPLNPNDLLWRFGTGNIYGSAEDLYKFDQALTNGSIITQADADKMQNDMYGWFGPTNIIPGQTDYTKAGAMHGGECVYYRFPGTDTTIIIMADIDPKDLKNKEDHVEYLGDQIASILFGQQS